MSQEGNRDLYRPTRSKFKRLKEPRQQPEIAENEVRITVSGYVKSYVEYGIRLLQGPSELVNDEKSEDEKSNTAIKNSIVDTAGEMKRNRNVNGNSNGKKQRQVRKITKKYDTIILRATGRAITTAVKTCETIKRLIQGLHQIINLSTLEIRDKWTPLEENLKPVYVSRKVASIEIKLSRFVTKEEKLLVGYQPPINLVTNGLSRVSTKSYSIKKNRGMKRKNRGGYRRNGNRRRRDRGRY